MAQAKIKAIVNANIVLERGIIWEGTLLISDDRILKAGKGRDMEIPEGAEIIDAEGRYVGPGFVDIHVHECPDGATYEKPVEAAQYFLRHGETTILATPFYGMDFDRHMTAIKTIKEALPVAKTIKGMYMEGPYTNPNYGAHAYMNPWRGPMDMEKMRALVDAAGTDVRVWAIGPEREEIMEFAEYARKVNPNVVFAVGHSEATPEQIRSMGKYRPTILTHAMCATGQLPTYGGTRAFGPDEYAFKEPDVFTELISDSYGIHVNAEMQQLLLHNKGVHRVVLITDRSVRHNPVPEKYAHIDDLNFNPTGGLSGSKLTMDGACRNIMVHTNCGIAQAFIMGSLNPAKAIGLGDEIGSIEPGKIADLVFVDDRFNVHKVMLGGEMCEF